MPQSSSSSPTRAGADARVVKHRACDECRTRKLACSKEPGGCSRCRQEGLTCVYSPQKPMGRPRKRRHVGESDEQQAASLKPAVAAASSSDANADASSSQLLQPATQQPGNYADVGYPSYLDAADFGNLNDLDLSYVGFCSEMNGMPQNTAAHDGADLSLGYTEPQYPVSGLQFGGVDLLGGISFDEQDPANQQVSEDINNTAMELISFSAAEEAKKAEHSQRHQQQPQDTQSESTFGRTSNSTSPKTAASSSSASPNSSKSSEPQPCSMGICVPKSLPHATCACLSQIYLAMDSLSRLPEDISEAMKLARMAAKTSHDVVSCEICSEPLTRDPSQALPMQSFQNLMLLGALIPTVANAYVRILEIVDETTDRAKQNEEKIHFRFTDFGGLWSTLGDIDRITCQSVHMYDDKEMNPDHWRLTIRALLKVDVYGFQVDRMTTPDGSHISHRHLGLKDVTTAMEERSNRRHDKIDALVAAGHPYPFKDAKTNLLIPNHKAGADHHTKKQDRQCLQIVEIARVSLDKLVIA